MLMLFVLYTLGLDSSLRVFVPVEVWRIFSRIVANGQASGISLGQLELPTRKSERFGRCRHSLTLANDQNVRLKQIFFRRIMTYL